MRSGQPLWALRTSWPGRTLRAGGTRSAIVAGCSRCAIVAGRSRCSVSARGPRRTGLAWSAGLTLRSVLAATTLFAARALRPGRTHGPVLSCHARQT